MCYSICMHENMTCWTAQISQSSEEDAVHWTCDMSTYGHLRVKHVCSTYYSNDGSDRGYIMGGDGVGVSTTDTTKYILTDGF